MRNHTSTASMDAASSLVAVAVASLVMVTSASAQSRLEDIEKAGSIQAAMAVEPPYADFATSGEVTGAGPEVLKAAMARLGVNNVKASVVDWGAMIPGLQARRFDVIATGLFMRPERCQAVAYSQPDLCATTAFAVKQGNPMGLDGSVAVKDKGAKLGVCGGCITETNALKAGVPRDNLVTVTDPLSGLQMLQAGRIDALAYTDITLATAIKTTGMTNVEVVAPVKDGKIECAGVAFHPEDTELRDAYDGALAELKASGEFAKILEPWGFNAQYAIDSTREKLCGAN